MRITTAVLAAISFIAFAGCQQEAKHDHNEEAHASSAPKAPPSPELAKVVLASGAPQQTIGVAQAKKEIKDGDPIALVGRVKDFVEGQAVFTVMDSKIPSCSDNPGDKCPTPWDYCCETKETVTVNSATVKIVGDGTAALKGNLHGVNSIDHLTTVVAEGKAQRDPAGNLTVLANRVYLTPS
ncbi:MAG: hypothetical protein ACR2IE_17620 [Candidatus Sumerlaeaceae bacterium]